MNYWLIKSEGNCYSIDDLKRDKKSPWSGVRNFQARNFMRDHMKVGDLALFYHSSSTDKANPNGVYGIAKVVSKAYPDETAFDPKDEHYDAKQDEKRKLALKSKSGKDAMAKGKNKKSDTEFVPMWMLVDFAFVEKFKAPISLTQMKDDPKLEGMMVRQAGSRLSIQPVSEKHFNHIVTMAH